MPTPGATSGSSESRSSETWTKPGPATRSSASRIACSIPIRSMSLIVKTRMSASRRNARSAGSSERMPTRATRDGSSAGSGEPLVGEPVRRPAEGRGERHPVHVAGRARLGRVEVAVGVDPDHAARLACGGGEPGEGAHRDRVVATEHERRERLAHRRLDERRQARAGVEDLRQVARALRRPARAPPARVRRRCRGRRRVGRSPSAAPRDPRSGSPTGPCRRRAGTGRGRAARR